MRFHCQCLASLEQHNTGSWPFQPWSIRGLHELTECWKARIVFALHPVVGTTIRAICPNQARAVCKTKRILLASPAYLLCSPVVLSCYACRAVIHCHRFVACGRLLCGRRRNTQHLCACSEHVCTCIVHDGCAVSMFVHDGGCIVQYVCTLCVRW